MNKNNKQTIKNTQSSLLPNNYNITPTIKTQTNLYFISLTH